MGKKAKHPEHENLERWLVSYADFITLLFATFTALYAITSADLAKMKDVSEAISQSFKQQSLISGVQSILQGKSPPQDNPNPISREVGQGEGLLEYPSLTYTEGESLKVQQTIKDIKKDMQALSQQLAQENQQWLAQQQRPATTDAATNPEADGVPLRGVEVAIQERGIRVSFDSRLLFESGSAALRPTALRFLDGVSERLKKFSGTNVIQVEGHTDNLPIYTAVYPSNWELSTARAARVVRHFIARHQFVPSYLTAAGFADTRPVGSNATATGRSKNRRIDVIVYSKSIEQKTDPRPQLRREETLIQPASPQLLLNKPAALPNAGTSPAKIGDSLPVVPVEGKGSGDAGLILSDDAN
ncbi:MAG: OmpA family protein [Candidatus Melainabacteria bacterium]|nr:OmpA family protein [Candidatus Melainabacteria bacterium]